MFSENLPAAAFAGLHLARPFLRFLIFEILHLVVVATNARKIVRMRQP